MMILVSKPKKRAKRKEALSAMMKKFRLAK